MDNVKQIFEDTGILIFKNALPLDIVASWRMAYDALSNPERVPEYNPVAVNEASLQSVLSLIASHPVILDAVEQIFGSDIALYNQRFVVKDKHARAPVFLHQDTPYHIGWPQKASVFVALSRVMPENGGLIFYPGTHKYGYLGDAGEISRGMLAHGEPVCPTLTQGDFVIMHSATWHCSGANYEQVDRILADIIVQPADDPSGDVLLRGEWRTPIRIAKEARDKLLIRSRASRLREMQSIIDGMNK